MYNRILLVDDDMDILLAYQRNLRKHFHVTIASSGLEAVKIISESEQFAAVLTDYNMPYMNGVDLLTTIRKLSPDTVRLMITGYADLQIAISAVNDGNIFRFLTKPVESDLLTRALTDSVEQHKLIIAEKDILEKTLKGSIKIMVDVLAATNPLGFSKANKLRVLSRKIAEKINLINLWEVEITALLSQIGSISVPNDVLEKYYKFEALNEQEKILIDNIYEYSCLLIKNIPRLEKIAESISLINRDYQKPHFNSDIGGLNEIPIISRILKIVIDYENFVERNLSPADAIFELIKHENKYDPEIFSIFDSIVSGEEYLRKKKLVPFKQLRIAMTLAEDMRDEKGTLLLSKGREITDVVLMKLINLSKIRKIVEPILVFEELI